MPELSTGPFSPQPAYTNVSDASPAANVRAAGTARFTIERLHAKGGLGQVSVALDGQLRRRVALKEIRPDRRGEEARRRFLVEAEITGQLEHPGIVPIYALEKDAAGEPYYAMRLIQGRTMSEAIREYHDGRRVWGEPGYTGMAFRDLLQRFVSVCQTMAYAHSKGVIHRDLKPANVMLGEYGETLAVDWGLAKEIGVRGQESGVREGPFIRETAASADSPSPASPSPLPETKPAPTEATKIGDALGTPAYMAPEQARGEWDIVGPAADIFSLGAILYELLTSHPPLQGRDLMEVLESAKAGHFAPPRKVKSDVPKALEAICLKAMAAKLEERYSTAKELAGDVEHWLADEAVGAWRESWSVRARRWGRNHRTLVSTTAGVVVVGVIGLILSLVVVTQLNHDLDGANADLREAVGRETVERKRAESEAAIAKAVNDFLRLDLLDQVSVANRPLAVAGASRNPDLKVRELLDRASRRIEGKFADQPLTEAAIRSTIGGSYLDLGLYDEASKHYERAFQLRQNVLGPDHLETLYCMHNLGLLYHHQGKFTLAEALLVKVVERKAAKLGRDHLDVVFSKGILAEVYDSLAKYDQAESLLSQSLDVRISCLGPNHPETLMNQYEVAALWLRQGKYERAEPLIKQVLEKQTALLGADHHDATLTLAALAHLYSCQGKYAEAETLQLRLLEICTAVKGIDHVDTLTVRDDLGVLYWRQHKYDKAEPLLTNVLSKRTKLLGADHKLTLTSQHNVALLYENQGKLDDSEAIWKLVIEKRTKVLGEDHPDTLSSMGNLASLFWRRRNFEKSVALFEKVLAAERRTRGEEHPDTPATAYNLAVNYRDAGRLNEATATIEEWLPRGRAKLGFNHPATQFGVTTALSIYERTGALAKAEPLLRDIAAMQKDKHGAESMEYAVAHFTVANILLMQKKYADAESILRDCLAIYNVNPAGQKYVPGVKWEIGKALVGQHKYADAEPLLLSFWGTVHQAATKNPKDFRLGTNNHKRLTQSIGSLVRLYDAWGKKDEADKWRKLLAERLTDGLLHNYAWPLLWGRATW